MRVVDALHFYVGVIEDTDAPRTAGFFGEGPEIGRGVLARLTCCSPMPNAEVLRDGGLYFIEGAEGLPVGARVTCYSEREMGGLRVLGPDVCINGTSPDALWRLPTGNYPERREASDGREYFSQPSDAAGDAGI